MTTETINLICEKLAELFDTTVETIQQYLPDFLHQYGLYLATKNGVSTILIVLGISAIAAPLFLLMLADLCDNIHTPKKIFIALIIIIVFCLIIYIVPHFIFPEFYAIEQLISS